MAALKKHLMSILFGLAVLGSLGLAGWAYSAGDSVHKQLQEIDSLRNQVTGLAGSPANVDSIAKRKVVSDRRNEKIDQTVNDALRRQNYNVFEDRPRQLLIPEILPEPKSDAAMIDFKSAFNAAFAEINQRLRARDEPTGDEINKARQFNYDPENDMRSADRAWGPTSVTAGGPKRGPMTGTPTRAEVLSSNAVSKLSEQIAKQIFMYVDVNALGPHEAALPKTTLNPERIWHAHMTLWIAQDFAAALGGLNDARASELEAAGRGYDAWVANMPVKRISELVIDEKLGRGGGINVAQRMKWAGSFTNDRNDGQHFMVPLRLTLVVEEAAVMDVMDAICAAGYYTPLRVEYEAIPPNPLQEGRIYGDAPVVELKIDLEGYFFRVVFEDWIPKDLKKILSTPDAVEENKRR